MPGGDAVARAHSAALPRRCGTIRQVVRSTVVTKHGSQASSTPASPNIRSNIGRAVRTESNDTIGTVNRRWIAAAPHSFRLRDCISSAEIRPASDSSALSMRGWRSNVSARATGAAS